MLTPAFDISQNNDYLTIIIKTPYAKISETEIFIEECDFRFHSKPYFLRLTLPGPVIEDGRENAKYDAESGNFTVRVPKANVGEHFDGLDMLTKLLAPSGAKTVDQPCIEVIGDAETDCIPNEMAQAEEEEEEFDWQIEQSPHIESEALVTDGPMYGFANQKCGVFKRLQEELCDVIDLPDADVTPAQKRHEFRTEHELTVFDDEHYMADFCDEDGIIQSLLDYQPDSDKEYKMLLQEQDPHEFIKLTEDEKEVMRKLPRKEYLLDSVTKQQVYLGLVDILLGYAYNLRATEGENTVESGWTVCKLSGSLSWLQTFSSVNEVILAWHRSSLCYPLYRQWALSQKVITDVFKILKLGKRKVLKCLLETRSLLLKTDYRYILNDLFINDYCVWIQSASKKRLDSLAENLKQVEVSKKEVGFDLDVLEQACLLAREEADATDDMSSTLTSMHIHEHCIAPREEKENSRVVENSIKVENSYLASSTNSEEDEDETSDSSDYTSESETDVDSNAENIGEDTDKESESKHKACVRTIDIKGNERQTNEHGLACSETPVAKDSNVVSDENIAFHKLQVLTISQSDEKEESDNFVIESTSSDSKSEPLIVELSSECEKKTEINTQEESVHSLGGENVKDSNTLNF